MEQANQLEKNLKQALGYSFINQLDYRNALYGPKILSNQPQEGKHVLTDIQAYMRDCLSFDFNVAFITLAGIGMLKTEFHDLAKRGGHGRILISPYLGFNDPKAMVELLKLENIQVRLAKQEMNVHAKTYLFNYHQHQTLVVGSSNLTDSAMKTNYEWNISLNSSKKGHFIGEVQDEFERIWDQSTPLTQDIIDRYNKLRQPVRLAMDSSIADLDPNLDFSDIKPNLMQAEALAGIDSQRREGNQRVLVVSATGTGKTYLAAFDVRNYQPKRMLFIVHREQILRKALKDFQRVIGFRDEEGVIYKSGMRLDDKRYVFATIHSIARDDNLRQLAPDLFDYILVDEVHRAGANSYLKVMNYFQPDFYLGMTATPERTDGFNIYELFDYNVAYEIRLQAALEEEMLCPFLYYGVSELYADGQLLEEDTDFQLLTSEARVDHIIEKTQYYGVSSQDIKGLMFCSNTAEAHEISNKLNQRGFKTQALTGSDSQERREETIQSLIDGDLEYIITVDIFNEGIDIPEINQVVMLRNTESSIIFVQQLGRGLRKHPTKEFVTIIDFIGNYRNNYLIPVALYGDRSMNKDNYRRNMGQGNQINGITTVNFEAIASQQVFKSITNTKLSSIAQLKKSFTDLMNRLGRPPYMIDFIEQDHMDPAVFYRNNAFKHYGDVLSKFLKEDAKTLPKPASQILDFMTRELMNGKRPHELMILRQLFSEHGQVSTKTIESLFESEDIYYQDKVRRSVNLILTYDFFGQTDSNRYGDPFVLITDDGYQLTDVALEYLEIPYFIHLAMDIIETGLTKSQDYSAGYRQDALEIGQKYSRKDACRLLGWVKDESSVIYGYRTKYGTCPIFVTYHKEDDISLTTMYQDSFIDEHHFHWYTRNNLTLESPEVIEIRESQEREIDIHLFIKKEDAEGSQFYYLGPVHPIDTSFEQTTMFNGKRDVPVVTMDLELEHSTPYSIYQYLTRGGE